MRAFLSCCATICLAGTLSTTLQAHAQTYPATLAQQEGSDPAAADAAKLDAFLRDAKQLTAIERRTLEIIRQAAQHADIDASWPHEEPAQGGTATSTEEELPVVFAASPADENVRDPCLLSWDPQCYAKHAADYDPRWGYAPSILRGASDNASDASATNHSQTPAR